MKTTFFYGLIMAIGGTLMNYILYFTGFHDSADKMKSAQIIGMTGGVLIGIVCLVLAARARRDETPATEGFSYGRSFGACFLTGLWGVLLGTVSHVLYIGVVNPEFRELIVQGELAKMEARGMSSTQIEQAEGMVRMMTGPIPQGIIGLIMGLIFWTLIGLIIAAFIRRPAPTPAQAAA
jgi:hypothetical protein